MNRIARASARLSASAAVLAAVLAAMLAAMLVAMLAVTAVAVPVAASQADRAAYCPSRHAYEVTDCDRAPRLPASAVSGQLRWVLDQLAGAAATLSAAEVSRHFTAQMLALPGLSAPDLVGALQGTLAQFGPLHFEGFSYPPRSHQALALVRAGSGFRAEVPISVARSGLIDSLAVSGASPVIVPHGAYSGWFDVGAGRQMFLRCTGSGSPTVVFENGLTTDWYALQNRLSPLTRTCSYDPARQNGPSSRSDEAPAPRTGDDRVSDLHALLAAARVPGPYVIAAHSNGGLFSLVYASRYPAQVAGLVLIDGVHPDYHRRTFDALKHLFPRRQWPAIRQAFCAIPPLQFDWEQMDICRSEAQARAQLAAAPLKRLPLAVISHGVAEGPPGPETDIAERVWQQLQRELAALEPGSEHVIARRSGHDIQHTQPGLVAGQIREVVEAVRDGESTLLRPTRMRVPRR